MMQFPVTLNINFVSFIFPGKETRFLRQLFVSLGSIEADGKVTLKLTSKRRNEMYL